MERTVGSDCLFHFGLFEADPGQNLLTRNGTRVKIQEQPFRLLLLLLARPSQVVSREELRQKLWPEGTYVDFDGSLNVILKRLRAALDDDPDNPRFIETIPRRGYRFIAPVSHVDRNSGSARAQAGSAPVPPVAAAANAGEAEAASLPSFPENAGRGSRISSHKLRYAALGLALALGVAGSLAWRSRVAKPWESGGGNPAIAMRKSVAVLGFRDLSGPSEASWLGTALSEMMSTELAAGEKLRLISGEDVSNLRVASPWPQADTLDRRTTAHIGAALNCDVLVLGSYTVVGTADRGQLRLDVRMQDAKSGEILIEIAEMGTTQDLFSLVSHVGAQLRNRLGIEQVEDTQEAGVLAAVPLDPQAARFYSLGVSKLRQFDALAAKDLLQQAAKIDPKFSLVHTMLARAWAQLGYEQERREEAKLALDLGADLPRAQRMLVEGEYYESLGDQERAASVYHALFELFPDNIEYGLRLATVESLAGHGSQAMEVVHRLRSLPKPSSEDPRIDLVESRAMADNKPAALALVRSAMRKAAERKQTLIYASARREECMHLAYGDKPSQAVPSCEEAYNTFLAAGNRLGAADSIRLMGDEIGSEGRYQDAIATYQRALNLIAGSGEHEKTGAILNNMAINFANEGQLDEAEKLYREAKAHFEAAGDKANTATAMANIADIVYSRGNLAGAARLYQDTLSFIVTLDRSDPGYVSYRLADLRLAQADIKDAHRLAQQAIDSIRPTQGNYQYLSMAMLELGEVLEAEGDLAGARSQLEQALATQQKMGSQQLAAETQVALAGLAVEEHHPENAEPLLRAAIADFEREKSDPDASSAYTLLSRALRLEGKIDEARQAAQRGAELARTSSDPALKLPAEIEQARLDASGMGMSMAASARKRLSSVAATAHRLGYYTLEAQARLALAEMDMQSNPSAAHRQLAALAADSHSRGLELLARNAESALARVAVVAQDSSRH